MPSEEKNELLRLIPRVDELADFAASASGAPREIACEVARSVTNRIRESIVSGRTFSRQELSLDSLGKLTVRELENLFKPSFKRVINATGVVLHTNLGRAPLSEEALNAIKETSQGYSNLEYRLSTGERGSRQEHLEGIICRLTGSESAFVVNNNAAAVLQVLTALARGREVIVSRGELIEIGDSFRLPDIMLSSGAKLCEVGTTNRTKLSDYREAIGPDTALILKTHMSNYRILGYSEEVSIFELSKLAHEHFIPLVEDLGSGSLIDLTPFGLEGEHTPMASIKAGADIVTFSGDKLLGGPQAGLVVGKAEYINAIRKHPLARALRIDKITVAALEATLREYLNPEKVLIRIPALKMLLDDEKNIEKKAKKLKRILDKEKPEKIQYEVVREFSTAGGGSLPLASLPTWCLKVKHSLHSAYETSRLLRESNPPVIARMKDDSILIDLRCIHEEEISMIADALLGIQ